VISPAQGRAKKQRMPKLSAVTLAAGLLALAGCGSSSNTTSSATTPSSSTATTTATTTPTTTAAGPNAAATEAVPAGNSLTLEANPEGQLQYNKTSLSATAGKVSIAFTDSSPLEHNVTVESSSGKILGATPTFKGGTKVLTLALKAGTYKFFCSVPGHRQAGMEGTLTVK
jgi:plastocyanin